MLPVWVMYVGIFINAVFTLDYLILTLKGKVKPNRVTWLTWSIAPLIGFLSQISQKVGVEAFLTLSFSLIPFSIFVASFFNPKAYWKLSKFDLVCGILATTGLILWQITSIPNIALIFSIMADFLGGLPTFRKIIIAPETEEPAPYLAASASGLLTLFTLKQWTFQNYAFSLYIFIWMGIVGTVALIKNKQSSSKKIY